MTALAVLALAFLVSLALCRGLLWEKFPFRMLDRPGHRSLHDSPKPRGGGLGILVGSLAGWSVLSGDLDGTVIRMLPAAFAVALVSLVDDVRPLHPAIRLAVHGAAAGLAVTGYLGASTPLWIMVATSLAVIWMINLYNFMDGMDGFAGGMAVIGFGCLGLAGLLHGQNGYALACGVVSAASLGFLIFNFPPSRLFMGDVGSATVGFLAAVFALWGIRDGWMPVWTAPMVFSPFIADATVTLIRRMLRREIIWQAHRSHYYQRLVQLGWGHRRTVLVEYVLMLTAGASGIWSVIHPEPGVGVWLIAGWTISYLVLMRGVRHLEQKAGMRSVSSDSP